MRVRFDDEGGARVGCASWRVMRRWLVSDEVGGSRWQGVDEDSCRSAGGDVCQSAMIAAVDARSNQSNELTNWTPLPRALAATSLACLLANASVRLAGRLRADLKLVHWRGVPGVRFGTARRELLTQPPISLHPSSEDRCLSDGRDRVFLH